MSDDQVPPPLRFFAVDAKPESTQLNCSVEVEVKTNHYHNPRPRRHDVEYRGYESFPFIIFSDLEICVRINGEEVARITNAEGDPELIDSRYKRVSEYLKEHVEAELKRTLTNLLQDATAPLSSSEVRKKYIESRISEEDKALRRRLPTSPKGMSLTEKGKFIDKALVALRELERDGRKVNRTNLAAIMYLGNSNQLQTLSRNVCRAGFTNPTTENAFDDFLYILMDIHASVK